MGGARIKLNNAHGYGAKNIIFTSTRVRRNSRLLLLCGAQKITEDNLKTLISYIKTISYKTNI